MPLDVWYTRAMNKTSWYDKMPKLDSIRLYWVVSPPETGDTRPFVSLYLIGFVPELMEHVNIELDYDLAPSYEVESLTATATSIINSLKYRTRLA